MQDYSGGYSERLIGEAHQNSLFVQLDGLDGLLALTNESDVTIRKNAIPKRVMEVIANELDV